MATHEVFSGNPTDEVWWAHSHRILRSWSKEQDMTEEKAAIVLEGQSPFSLSGVMLHVVQEEKKMCAMGYVSKIF